MSRGPSASWRPRVRTSSGDTSARATDRPKPHASRRRTVAGKAMMQLLVDDGVSVQAKGEVKNGSLPHNLLPLFCEHLRHAPARAIPAVATELRREDGQPRRGRAGGDAGVQLAQCAAAAGQDAAAGLAGVAAGARSRPPLGIAVPATAARPAMARSEEHTSE